MSRRKQNTSLTKIIAAECIVSIAMMIMLLLLLSLLILKEKIGFEFAQITVFACVFISSIISTAVVRKLTGRKEIKAALTASAIIVVIVLILSVLEEGSVPELKTVLCTAVCILAGKLIPFVIKDRSRRTRKRK